MLQEGREESFPDMKKGLRGKFQNKKGFTLVEMLIVVAIIAILIAVSIPLVSGALEKARDATDQANERAAKAVAAIKYLSDEEGSKTGTFWYDAVNGKLENSGGGISPYGQCTEKHDSGYNSGSTDTKHTDKVIKVVIADGGEITISWETPSGSTP